jgi:hypothetical protein
MKQVADDNYKSFTVFEFVGIFLFAVIGGLWAYSYIGTTKNWDDLLYMSLSQYTVPESWVLNRYGHIYLQKLFMFLAGDAITGGKIFWLFIYFGTCVLIYFCARLIDRSKSRLVELIAVLFFIMLPDFVEDFGCTLSDFTVMFICAVMFLLFLLLPTKANRLYKFMIILLGLLFFWAVKSKETGFCMIVLFFGLGRDENDIFALKRFFKDIGLILLGVLAGCVLLMVLDFAFLGDFFFSVRPSNIMKVLDYNFNAPTGLYDPYYSQRPIISWFNYMTTTPLLALLVFYLLAPKANGEPGRTIRKRLLSIVPLFTLVFLTYIRSSFTVLPRYFAPSLPFLCVFAAQFFDFDFSRLTIPKNIKLPKYIAASAGITIAFILVYILMRFVPSLIEFYKNPRELAHFYAVAIMPLAVLIILILVKLTNKQNLWYLFVSFFCLFMILYLPLQTNINDAKSKALKYKSEWRFEPLSLFGKYLELDKNKKILVSQNVHKKTWMLGRNQQSQTWIFNVGLNQKLSYDQFIDGSEADILKGDYDYAILIADEQTAQMSKKPEFQKLLSKYELIQADAPHPSGEGAVPLILLKKR